MLTLTPDRKKQKKRHIILSSNEVYLAYYSYYNLYCVLNAFANCPFVTVEDQISKAELRLTDIADTLQGDWVVLARQLHISEEEITKIQTEYTYVSEQALVMLHLWVQKNGDEATGSSSYLICQPTVLLSSLPQLAQAGCGGRISTEQSSCAEGPEFDFRSSQTDDLPNLYSLLPSLVLGISRIGQ